jgi:hypothetical protein
MSNQITVNDGVGDVVYEQISQSNSENIFRDVASSLANPCTLRIAHTDGGPNGTDRHLVQFARTDDDADGMPITGTVHIVIAAPRTGVAKADLETELTKLCTLVAAEWDDIYNGFVPLD